MTCAKMTTLRLFSVGTWHDRPSPHPSTTVPQNEARLQPWGELQRVPGFLLQQQAWMHRRRGLHSRPHGQVPLQHFAQCRELLAEEIQRFAAKVLEVFLPRVALHGLEERRGHRLRRQTHQSLVRAISVQQHPQLDRGSLRNLRVFASEGRPFFLVSLEGRRRRHSTRCVICKSI